MPLQASSSSSSTNRCHRRHGTTDGSWMPTAKFFELPKMSDDGSATDDRTAYAETRTTYSLSLGQDLFPQEVCGGIPNSSRCCFSTHWTVHGNITLHIHTPASPLSHTHKHTHTCSFTSPNLVYHQSLLAQTHHMNSMVHVITLPSPTPVIFSSSICIQLHTFARSRYGPLLSLTSLIRSTKRMLCINACTNMCYNITLAYAPLSSATYRFAHTSASTLTYTYALKYFHLWVCERNLFFIDFE